MLEALVGCMELINSHEDQICSLTLRATVAYVALGKHAMWSLVTVATAAAFYGGPHMPLSAVNVPVLACSLAWYMMGNICSHAWS